jgi:hypothetical protein
MQRPAACQALDRGDRLAFGHDGQGETGVHALSVEQDGAGAALAERAALLGAGQIQPIPQHVEQRLACVDRAAMRLSVDQQSDVETGGVSRGRSGRAGGAGGPPRMQLHRRRCALGDEAATAPGADARESQAQLPCRGVILGEHVGDGIRIDTLGLRQQPISRRFIAGPRRIECLLGQALCFASLAERER